LRIRGFVGKISLLYYTGWSENARNGFVIWRHVTLVAVALRSQHGGKTNYRLYIIISPMVIVTYRNSETWSYNRKRTLLFCDLPNLPSTLRQPDMDCRTVQTTVKEILVCLGPRRTNYFLFLMHRV